MKKIGYQWTAGFLGCAAEIDRTLQINSNKKKKLSYSYKTRQASLGVLGGWVGGL